MSIEREVETTVGKVAENKPLQELTKAEKKARLASVLERGLTIDRLKVDLPPDLYGEWVPNDESEISRMQLMGFEVDTTYAPKRALHGSGSGEARVSDVIFMVTNAETKALIDEIRKDKFIETHGSPNRDKRTMKQKEEAEFQSGSPLPTVNESASSSVQGQEIAAQLFNNS